MKIKINIPGFGERYCSNNVEYELSTDIFYYTFYKKGTKIFHNEYGPAIELKDGIFRFYLNNKKHKLNGPAYIGYNNFLYFHVINIFLGENEKEFIENLANVLIPKGYKDE